VTDADSTPENTLRAARDVLTGAIFVEPGVRPRASALLGRQALEAAVERVWASAAPGVEDCSRRAQLLCLSGYVAPELAERTNHAYWALTESCHHHPYELAAVPGEVARWLDDVGAIVDASST
jgi:hypothetical protein